jgi:hypothetical protein
MVMRTHFHATLAFPVTVFGVEVVGNCRIILVWDYGELLD